MSSTGRNKVEEAALAWSMFSASERAAARWVLLEAAAAIAEMPRSRGWTTDEALLHAQTTIVGLERDRLRAAAEPETKASFCTECLGKRWNTGPDGNPVSCSKCTAEPEAKHEASRLRCSCLRDKNTDAIKSWHVACPLHGDEVTTAPTCAVCGGEGRIYTCVMDAATDGRPCPACSR